VPYTPAPALQEQAAPGAVAPPVAAPLQVPHLASSPEKQVAQFA
jgi:hypothetical protein